MTEKEKMLSGKLYTALDKELGRELLNARRITRLFNNTLEGEFEVRQKLLNDLFEKTGENIYIEPPFRCDYGCHISVGDRFYANFDCIFLDVNKITIGNNVFLGPRVSIFTACHPIDASVRNTLLEYGKPVSIGNGVWIGGNTVINPGVTIGNNVIIGSGSVVTKNIPDNVIAAGNPCKVLRAITKEDQEYWEDKQREYHQQKNG
ncbi:MAG: sugar O-acetyltransferase [Bacteroidales bacterium]|jgi:maltose O-acetyltransferase|nr:sugar O-acetyltransferase [Bacteroidales bacterium]